MTVKHLRLLLEPEEENTEVLVRVTLPHYEPERMEIAISFLTRTVEPDTAAAVVFLECEPGDL